MLKNSKIYTYLLVNAYVPVKNMKLCDYFSLGLYVLELWIICLMMLKYTFYISFFNNLITHQTKSNVTVSHYTSAFGTIRLTGILFALLLGPYTDGRLMSCESEPNRNFPMSKKKETLDKLKRCAVAICIANLAGIILELTCLLPVFELQYISMLSQVVLRGFLGRILFETFQEEEYLE